MITTTQTTHLTRTLPYTNRDDELHPDRDLGSCGRAGLQNPPGTSSTLKADMPETANGPTDLFGRPLHRREEALNNRLVRGLNWINWPRVGDGFDVPDGRSFAWDRHAAAFRAGTVISVYVSVCDGLCSLGKSTRLSLAKVGTSTRPDLAMRIAEANADRYASIHQSDGHIKEAVSFDSWEALRLPAQAGPAYPSPVERLPRSLMVSLPADLTADAFDAALTAALEACRVALWIETRDGQMHCARHDVDARMLHRFTAHTNADGSIRLKKAREIYVFRRQQDTERLVRMIEGLVAKHLVSA